MIHRDGNAFNFGILETEQATTSTGADAEKMTAREGPPVWRAIVSEKVTSAPTSVPNISNGVRIRFDDTVSEKAQEIRPEKRARRLKWRVLKRSRTWRIRSERKDVLWRRCLDEGRTGGIAVGPS